MRTIQSESENPSDFRIETFRKFLEFLSAYHDLESAVTFLPDTWGDWKSEFGDDTDVFVSANPEQRRGFVRSIDHLLKEFPKLKLRKRKLIFGLSRIEEFYDYPFGSKFSKKRILALAVIVIVGVGMLLPWPMPEPPASDLAMDVLVFPSPTEGIAAGAEGRLQGSIRPSMFPEVRIPRVAIYSHRDEWRLERMPTLRSTNSNDRLSWSCAVRAATDYAIIVFDPSALPEASLPGSFADITKRPPSLRYGRWLLPLGNWDGSKGSESNIEWKTHAKKHNETKAKMEGTAAPIAKDQISVGGWRWPWWLSAPAEGNRALRVEYDIREGQDGWVSARMRKAPVLSRSALVGFSTNFAGVSVTEFEFDIKAPSLGEMEDDHAKNLLTVRGPDQWQRFRLSLTAMKLKRDNYRDEDLPESGEVVLSLNDRDFVGKKGGAGSFYVDDAFILDVLP